MEEYLDVYGLLKKEHNRKRMDSFGSIVEWDNANNTCEPKVVQKFGSGDFLPMNTLLLRNGPPPPAVTFRGRNQQQGVRAIIDAFVHYTPTTIDVSQPPLEVSKSPKAVGETPLDVRNT